MAMIAPNAVPLSGMRGNRMTLNLVQPDMLQLPEVRLLTI